MSIDPPIVQTFGELFFGSLLAGLILTLAIFDLRHMILPDRLNLLLGTIGLAQSFLLGRPGPVQGVIGSLLGINLLYGLAWSFRRIRGVDGLGLGDQKFAAAAGLWIGWQGLPLMLLLAATSALCFTGVLAIADRGFDPAARIPFGPFLGLGTLLTWTWMVFS